MLDFWLFRFGLLAAAVGFAAHIWLAEPLARINADLKWIETMEGLK